jgi:hypothetical protein
MLRRCVSMTMVPLSGALVALSLLATGCENQNGAPPTVEVVGAVVSNQTLSQLHIDLPAGTSPGRFAVAAAGSLQVDDRALVRDSMGQSAAAANTGATLTRVGVTGKVGDLFSQASVDLRNNATVDGNLVTAGTVTTQPGATVKGTTKTATSIGPLAVASWTPTVPAGTGTAVTLQPNTTKTLAPGAYAQVTVNNGAVLHLGAGTYKLAGLDLESGSKLVLDSVAQPTQIYVTGAFIYRGLILDGKNAANNNLPLLLTVLGTTAVQIDPVFRGTLFVPNASLSVGPGTHYASFFARDVELRPDTIVELRRFSWTTVLPPVKITWGDAPVVLTSSKNYTTGVDTTATKNPPSPVTFTIPDWIYVKTGNAGTGQVELKFKTPGGVTVTCTYHGGARVAHPVTDLERMRGRRYRITSCDSGYTAGQTATGTSFTLHVTGGDAQDPAGMTSVGLNLGGGCSEILPAPLAAEEVVAMRDGFSWETIEKLPETDVTGRPALFHGLIYIDSKNQLAALDRMRVLWSAQPLSDRYLAGLRGKCGRVEHASDGRGVVVYAVFPAKLFNVMRDFAIQAIHGNVAPPFKFIIPSPPAQNQYVNSDGSLTYAGLGSSRYLEWLQTHPGGAAGWFDDVVDAVSDAAGDAWNWTKDKLLAPAANYGEYGFDYVVKGFDVGVDWTINFVDNAWEEIQAGLQEFVLVFSDKVTVNLQITMVNRDSEFPANTTMTRLWGPPTDGTVARPNLVPAGANVRVRQYGWGFLPVMDQAELGEDGKVTLEAVKGAHGERGDLCIEMDTDYAQISSDFIPNEVCDLADASYDSYYQADINATLAISQADLFGMTQIKDSADYFKNVIGTDTYTFDVLTGWIANELTATFNNGHRGTTLCLDFPNLSVSAYTTALTLVVPLIGDVLAFVSTALIAKDTWWPDADDTGASRDSRGVMTHEYGHFAMCSLLFAEKGPPGLTGLLTRLGEGDATQGTEDQQRGHQLSQNLEAIADTFAMQVVGGTNYIRSEKATGGLMGYCTASPCMDKNYTGQGDYRTGDGFHDELARVESLFYDAFDTSGSDSSRRFTNDAANGDIFQGDPDVGPISIAPTPYINNSDENISLHAPAWRTWIKHWLERGLQADRADVWGGLAQTMYDQGYKWCDVCDLFALHDKTTPLSAYAADPTGAAAPTMQQRIDRWKTCAQSADMKSWFGTPPAKFLNMDKSCNPCPLHNFVTADGGCQPCPANSYADGTSCVDCGKDGVATATEECRFPLY